MLLIGRTARQLASRLTIDAEQNRLDVAVAEEELAQRRARWKAPPYKAERGTLSCYS